MYRPLRAVVDTGAIRFNLDRLRAAAPDDRFLAVVKADGYGHGAIAVSTALEPDVDGFAVASVEEALRLREAGIAARIVLLQGVFDAEALAVAIEKRLDLVIHQHYQLELLLAAPQGSADVWLKVDTGMNRLGVAPSEVGGIVRKLQASGRVGTTRLMTHLACSDDRRDDSTPAQLRLFRETLGERPMEFSIANSAAVLGWPQARGGWARPGIALYGVSPFAGGTGETLGLRSAMHLQTRLTAVKPARRGSAVGYGGGWVCPEDMQLGIAAIGYGDGYPRHAPSGTPVLVKGRRASLVGRVSMDMIAIDLRTVPDASPGDEVTLWGPGLPVEDVARSAGTIGYELLSGLTSRVPRELAP